ncbi:MAG: hypothetical protein OHK0052_13360 [Anaerolineales bacterium]
MTEQASPLPRSMYNTPFNSRPFAEFAKRAFDLFGALVGLILLSPVFALIALWIKRDSPGPVFYWGRRAARGGGEFRILKFRTMYEHPQSYAGPKVTAQDDPRITPVGKWLRDTKLNELPQLWNVLKGEMSLVGPRPEDPDIVANWDEDVRREILSVRPGVTSPASVMYRDEESLLSTGDLMDTYMNAILPSKMRLDQLYVRNRTFLMDIDVIFWTLLVLLPRIGAYQPPEDAIFWGPASQIGRRYINWLMIDAVVSLASFSLLVFIWRSFMPLNIGWQNAATNALGFALLFTLVGAMFGIHKISWSKASSYDAYDLLPPTLIASGLALTINELFLSRPFPTAMVLTSAAVSLAGFVVVRYRSRLLRSFSSRILRARVGAAAARERVIIIGSGDAGQMAVWALNHNARNPDAFHVVGYIDDDLYKQDERHQGIRVIGRRQDIPALVKKYDVGVIIFAIHNIDIAERQRVLEICAQTPAQVVLLPDFTGMLNDALKLARAPVETPRQVTDPVVLSSPGIAPMQVAYWFKNLRELHQQGETELLGERLRTLEEQVCAHVKKNPLETGAVNELTSSK